MKLREITAVMEEFAPLSYQESYDNSGLLIGDYDMEVKGILLCIDVTDAVIDEAISLGVNLIISHHPLIFSGLKRVIGDNLVERCVIKAIKSNIAVYSAHTNMDNVFEGVNGVIADKLELQNRRILKPMNDTLVKLVTFAPKLHVQFVREAIFKAGAGHIGHYDSCSFNSEGYGSFRPNDEAKPFVGELNKIHYEEEHKIEVIVPKHLMYKVQVALIQAHPYEEPAYDFYPLLNTHQLGSGMIGELKQPMEEKDFIAKLKKVFKTNTFKHTSFLNKQISKVALCGGAGSFLLNNAIRENADVFISADFKYHDYFEADNKILIADVGHYETEQFTKELFYNIIQKKFPTFAVHISKTNTNPIIYS